MDDHIAEIHHEPAVAGESFLLTFFFVFFAHVFKDTIGQRIQHAVTGARAKHEIIGKRDDVFQIDQDDIFTLFIFKRIDNFTGKFKCFQNSPLYFSTAQRITLYTPSRRVVSHF
jgi:hypothetical protein